jgi:pantetheine-phosphate adenylyltransferase, bacterial
MSKITVYPGTFDPITNGHLDLLARAEQIFDQVVIAISENPRKSPLFSTEERIQLLEEAVADRPHVTVDSFNDLLVNYMTRNDIRFVIRGLRAVSDFEYEFQLASANRRLDARVETIFLTPLETNYFVSSSLVREISYYHGDVSSFVPKHVEAALAAKWSSKGRN